MPDNVEWKGLFVVGDGVTSPPIALTSPTVVTPT